MTDMEIRVPNMPVLNIEGRRVHIMEITIASEKIQDDTGIDRLTGKVFITYKTQDGIKRRIEAKDVAVSPDGKEITCKLWRDDLPVTGEFRD